MGFATDIVRPPPTPGVAADTRDLPSFGVRMAQAINQVQHGAITATLQFRLAVSDTVTVVQDSRIGMWSFVWLMPLSAAAAAKLASIWFELHDGTVSIHHAATGAGDVIEYIALIIG